MLIGRGTFIPGQGHVLEGSFTFNRTGAGVLMETSNDFLFDGSPLPGFALTAGVPQGKDDPELQKNMTDTRFLDLPGGSVQISGKQEGLILANTNIDDYDTLVLWCFRFPFILGFGRIEQI